MMVSINKLILKPLENLTNMAVRISRGEINQTINVDSNDEIGNLAAAFQKMQISLRIIMKRLTRKRQI